MKILTSDIRNITGGTLTGPPDLEVESIVTDSRQVSFSNGVMFVAIPGKNHDGHDFIPALYDSGVRIFISERPADRGKDYRGAAFIITGNSVLALQQVAAYKRSLFTSPVVAVTGSAGKTIVKEWLADIAGTAIPVVRSPRSYNSQTGVPLSVWKLDGMFRLGIFEAGISEPGEMEKLEKIIRPDIGIITNIGEAHSNNFPDLRSKAREKLGLFKAASAIIYCRDHEIIHSLIAGDEVLAKKSLIGWSFSDINAVVTVERISSTDTNTSLGFKYKGYRHVFMIPFIDRVSVENAITSTVACLFLDIPVEVIESGLSRLRPVAMRMDKKAGINNCVIIEDYYNSDPGSLGMAIEYLKMQSGRNRTLILSDFMQSGRNPSELYKEVAGLIGKTGVERFIGIGEELARHRDLFGPKARFWYSTEEFVRSFNSSDFRDEAILLKGARVFGFEKIAAILEQQIHQTVLEINLDAISSNLNEFRRHLNSGTQIMAMVKAFAYGAGPSEIASLMEFHRVNYLAVAYADEGIELRNSGVNLPVMVMNPDPGSSDLLIRYNLEPEIFSFSSLDRFTRAAVRYGVADYPVHIKIDTGMHRLGFLPDEVDDLVRLLLKSGCLRVISVFSHLAASEDSAMDSFTRRQAELLVEAAGKIRDGIGYDFMRHILNSAGIFRFPEYQFEMVRPGIAIYGVGHFGNIRMKPAGRFLTRISQVKRVRGGDPVGYGCADISESDRVIAIIPAGYADGMSRMLGNRRGYVFIKGSRAPIVGNVCMDMCMVDVTGINANEGDEVEIFGLNIPIEEIAEICNTIPYEILTSIPGRVKRVFFRE